MLQVTATYFGNVLRHN